MISFYLILVISIIEAQSQSFNPNDCVPRDYGHGSIVCVCNTTYCHTLPPIEKVEYPNYLVYTTNQDGLRFSKTVGQFNESHNTLEEYTFTVEEGECQEIMGFGGCFTDASGINIMSLSEEVREKLIRSYFDKNGSEYNMGRVPIGGTDFSTRGYSYLDGKPDIKLNGYKLAPEDYKYKIPMIKRAMELTNGNLKLFASAWTAPKWMKSNGKYSGLFGFLKKEMYQPWANYFVKFLDHYKQENISFWGITTGNEPSLALFTISAIPSVAWFPSQMVKWVSENLGPALRNSSYSDIKIMMLDDQRLFLSYYAEKVLAKGGSAKKYIDGISLHWYHDTYLPSNLLSKTHDKFPDKFILATEASFVGKVSLGSWKNGERYATDIIEDLDNWAVGWVDWNLAVDLNGGPTFINNTVDANIIVNATANEYYKQPTYYVLAHFSKFIPRGSRRLTNKNPIKNKNLSIVVLKRPDNGTTIEILNRSNNNMSLKISHPGKGDINLELTRKSLTTVVYW